MERFAGLGRRIRSDLSPREQRKRSNAAQLPYGDQTQLFTVMLVPQYTTHAAVFGGLDPVG